MSPLPYPPGGVKFFFFASNFFSLVTHFQPCIMQVTPQTRAKYPRSVLVGSTCVLPRVVRLGFTWRWTTLAPGQASVRYKATELISSDFSYFFFVLHDPWTHQARGFCVGHTCATHPPRTAGRSTTWIGCYFPCPRSVWDSFPPASWLQPRTVWYSDDIFTSTVSSWTVLVAHLRKGTVV